MHQIHLSDEVYSQVAERAKAEGFETVDAYVEDVLSQEVSYQTPNLDHLFTPERIAELDKIVAELDAGDKTYSSEEIKAHFEKKSAEWRKKNAG